MTTSLLLATVFVEAACDLCRQPKLTYPDTETGGRICLDCLEVLCEPLVGTERGEPLPELPPDPEICAMGEAIIAERRQKRLVENSPTESRGN